MKTLATTSNVSAAKFFVDTDIVSTFFGERRNLNEKKRKIVSAIYLVAPPHSVNLPFRRTL
jgi:hypothetical protein